MKSAGGLSAFGVEHVSKSYKKLAPKLVAAERASVARHPNASAQPLEGRLRENYAQWRVSAGQRGRPGSAARGDKEGAKAMVSAIGNINRRRGKKLP